MMISDDFNIDNNKLILGLNIINDDASILLLKEICKTKTKEISITRYRHEEITNETCSVCGKDRLTEYNSSYFHRDAPTIRGLNYLLDMKSINDFIKNKASELIPNICNYCISSMSNEINKIFDIYSFFDDEIDKINTEFHSCSLSYFGEIKYETKLPTHLHDIYRPPFGRQEYIVDTISGQAIDIDRDINYKNLLKIRKSISLNISSYVVNNINKLSFIVASEFLDRRLLSETKKRITDKNRDARQVKNRLLIQVGV